MTTTPTPLQQTEDEAPPWPRIALGIPVCGPPTWGLLADLIAIAPQLEQYIQVGENDRPYPIAEAHNRMAEAFLAGPCEWLLMVDRDARIHKDTLERLLSWHTFIVSALCFGRYPPITPTVYAGHRDGDPPALRQVQIDETRNWIYEHQALLNYGAIVLHPRPENALREVDFTGMHCLLVHREVFEKLKPPWFRRIAHNQKGTGADHFFCNYAKAAGYHVYVDRSVVAAHMYGEKPLGTIDFLAWDSIMGWETSTWTLGGRYAKWQHTQHSQSIPQSGRALSQLMQRLTPPGMRLRTMAGRFWRWLTRQPPPQPQSPS